MGMQMSGAAKLALESAKNWNQGTAVPPVSLFVAMELVNDGLITASGNLTRKGSIEAERLQRKRLDRLFG